ncbi:MAG: hypothetical protein B7Y41_04230 [Hydrogenophilales bacterium 28-61-23]|nr:MAG: hypothetical protein B7Y41_04230 [Hydrogenophilales bacterium 28-61-23]
MQRREFLVLAGLLVAGCATKKVSPPDTSGLRFSEAERKMIVDYYSAARALMPATTIPAQRAKAGDVLDSGQRPNKLPIDLAKLLPDLPDPYTRLTLGADVVLVNRNSHTILDVIPQVAF